jgi:hypothetical protein
MLRQAQPPQAKPQSIGNEQNGSAESLRKPSLAMVRKPGTVLSDRLFQRRLGLGSRRHVEGGTRSERVLFLYGRREGRGGGLCVCLNCDDEEKGLERALPIIAEAIAAGRLPAWMTGRCSAGKVETLRTDLPRVHWAKVAAEVRRLAVLAPADCEVEIIAAAVRLRQAPWLLDLFVKFARDQRRRWERAPRFMTWGSAPGGRRVLGSKVDLSGRSPLTRRLNTDDREVAAQRLRLLLWHAIANGQLPGGFKHEAWHLYGGKIPEKTNALLRRLSALPWRQYELQRELMAERLGYCASTLDWLTNHEEDRRQDPERRAKCDATLRSQERSKVGGKQTPKSRSWQFSRVGTMLHVHSKGHPIYGRVIIDRLTLDWPLPVQNRTAGEAHVKPAVDARQSVKKAADDWRKCAIGSSEAKDASKALLRAQHRFRDALAAVGAKRSKNWAKAAPQFDELPFDETSRLDLEGCTRWFVELLLKNPERPPPGRLVPMLLEEADTLFHVGGRGARRCYEFAQEKTGNRNWSTTRRPRKSAS